MVKKSLTLYPAPEGIVPAHDFALKVDGSPVFVYPTRVSAGPINQVWPGYQRPYDQTELASFAYFDMDQPVIVEVTSTRPVSEVVVRPLSLGIQPVVQGSTITFQLPRPCQAVVEVNGWHHALHLFASPPEEGTPQPGEDGVRYFAPGLHQAGKIEMHSGETVYIAGGAVVYGVIQAENAHDIKILGRGILDASRVSRFDAGPVINLRSCAGIEIRGIIIHDPHVWAVTPSDCEDVLIANIKLIGFWRYNADGIDIVNSEHVVIEDCFIRSFDDSIVIKGLNAGKAPDGTPGRQVNDVISRRCVVWNDWGRGLEIGAETQAVAMKHLIFQDCDVIHFVHRAMDIQHGDRAEISDVVFENIRVEDPILAGARIADQLHKPEEIGLLIELIIAETMWNKDKERGTMQDIRFKDIWVQAQPFTHSNFQGFNAAHMVDNVIIENLVINGKRITSLAEGRIAVNDYVRNVEIK